MKATANSNSDVVNEPLETAQKRSEKSRIQMDQEKKTFKLIIFDESFQKFLKEAQGM